MTDPTFTIEDDAVGLGFCTVAVWPEGRRETSQWSDAGSEPVPEDCRDVLKSEGGWSLIASQGKPIGYVATRNLAPGQWRNVCSWHLTDIPTRSPDVCFEG
jgi:hypothetical protein